jgi:hypothetical protein
MGAGTNPVAKLHMVGDLLIEDVVSTNAPGGDIHIRADGAEVRIETTSNAAASPSTFRLLESGGQQYLFNLNPNSNAFTIRDVNGATDRITLNSAGDVTFSGNISKGGGSFKIDHPLDPANKFLFHSFVESPDMMNVYNGNARLDGNGQAIVELPDYFEALNQDFRYQLTAIGAPGPNLYIAREIEGNRFVIAGGQPGASVSWQITGIRHDPWAEQHRIQVEVDKGPERGYYQHPQVYDQPIERGISNIDSPHLKEAQTINRQQ